MSCAMMAFSGTPWEGMVQSDLAAPVNATATWTPMPWATVILSQASVSAAYTTQQEDTVRGVRKASMEIH